MSAAGRPLALDVPPGAEGAVRVHAAVRDALVGGGPAVALGPTGDAPDHAHAAAQRAALAVDAPLEAEGVAVLITTSGSSGDPVGVLLGSAALTGAARATHAWLPRGAGRWVVATPVTSVGGLMGVVRSIDAGLDPVVWSGVGGAASFTPDSFRGCLEQALALSAADGAPAYAAMVPTQLARLVDDPATGELLARLDHVLIGAAALPQVVRRRAEAAGISLSSTYGATETCGGVVYDGEPLPGVTAEVRDDGRIALGGVTIALGYRGHPDLTATTFVDGQYVSADIGEWVDDRLRVLGRVDDVVKVGGRKVSLPALADAARGVAGVADAVAVAVDDDEWGKLPVLAVVGSAEEGAVRAAVASAIGATRMRLVPMASLPYLPNGKVDRRAVRAAIEEQP